MSIRTAIQAAIADTVDLINALTECGTCGDEPCTCVCVECGQLVPIWAKRYTDDYQTYCLPCAERTHGSSAMSAKWEHDFDRGFDEAKERRSTR